MILDSKYGGGGGIRTLGTFKGYDDLANRWFQPLTHASVCDRADILDTLAWAAIANPHNGFNLSAPQASNRCQGPRQAQNPENILQRN
jgi:hypothetical protein